MKVGHQDTSFKRVKEITDFAKVNGVELTAVNFGIKKKTVRNYMALMKLYDENYVAKAKQPKILLLDIETAPTIASVWGMWKQNVQPNQIISDWYILTWAAKWLYSDETISDKLTADEACDMDDKRLLEDIWNLMNDADIIIAHNGDKFDIPKLNTRFLLNGYNPPAPYQTIDTLKGCRNAFRFSHNRMDYVNKVLGLDQKVDTGGMALWLSCMAGDEEALAKMESYNINDVVILEELYLAIRAWIKPHPNVGMLFDGEESRCHVCGSTHLIETLGTYNTSVNMYHVYECHDCGSSSRGRSAIKKGKERENLLAPTAR